MDSHLFAEIQGFEFRSFEMLINFNSFGFFRDACQVLRVDYSMSKGHCGYAHLVASDDTLLLYSYCAYDINRADWQEMKKKEDGEIAIDRDSLIEPEVHEKVKRLPSGKRTIVVKRIEREVPYEDLLQAKKVRIQNASGAWDFSKTGIDEAALKIVRKIFSEYQKTGNIPDHPTWYV